MPKTFQAVSDSCSIEFFMSKPHHFKWCKHLYRDRKIMISYRHQHATTQDNLLTTSRSQRTPSWSDITHNAIDRKLVVSHLVTHVQNLMKFIWFHMIKLSPHTQFHTIPSPKELQQFFMSESHHSTAGNFDLETKQIRPRNYWQKRQ